jgi:hypothetical protein
MANRARRETAVSDVVARRVRDLRKGMSVQELARRCDEAGMPSLTAQALYRMDQQADDRPHRTVTVDELVVLAHVLGVAPALLISPVDDDQVELVPGRPADPWDAVLWIGGIRDRGVYLAFLHDHAVHQWEHEPERLGGPLALLPRPDGMGQGAFAREVEKSRRPIEQSVRQIRAEMRDRGLRPPVLPAELRHVDEKGSD